MSKIKKHIFIMVDGLGDVSIPELDNKTPLQYQNLPYINSISATGINGLLDPVEPGLACGSDTAHLSILGYNPRKYYRGRGAFESMGAGLSMLPGDIAFKSNFATLDPTTNIVISRRADRVFEHLGPTLCEYLSGIKLPSFSDKYRVDFQYATEHRCGVRIRGPDLDDNITSTDPLKDNLPLLESKPLNGSASALLTSKIVNELSTEIHKALSIHPINEQRLKEGKPLANIVLLRGCGARIDVPIFQDLHGLKPFMIAPTCIIAGLGMCLNIDIIKVPEGTGDYHTNLISKAKSLISNLLDQDKNYTFGFVHIKAVDDAGHDKNVEIKLEFLKKIDDMVGYILNELVKTHEFEFSINITGDHSTPVKSGDHSYEPVPFAISKLNAAFEYYQQTVQRGQKLLPTMDSVTRFDEISASKGLLGRFTGAEVMGIIKKFM